MIRAGESPVQIQHRIRRVHRHVRRGGGRRPRDRQPVRGVARDCGQFVQRVHLLFLEQRTQRGIEEEAILFRDAQ